MFPKRPSLQIDKIEKIEINVPLHPFMERVIVDYLKANKQAPPYFWQSYPNPDHAVHTKIEDEKSTLLSILEYMSKGVSILSGVAVIVFVIFLISGQTSIGNVQIGTLLTILSFTLVGGLVSIGGVKIFSINANLRKAKEKMERVVTTASECPFLPLFAEQRDELHRPGNPRFCVKCPLGIDTNSKLEEGLMHNCSVYPILHRQWRELPNVDKRLYR